MSISLEVIAAVYKKEREPTAQWYMIFLRLASRALHVEKYLAFTFAKWEGEDVGRICFLSIGPIHLAREHVATDNQGELVALPQDRAGDLCKGNTRLRAG